jgi:hypothetical protein
VSEVAETKTRLTEHREWRQSVLVYSIAFTASVLLGLLWLKPWSVDWAGQFSSGGDLLWALASVQAHGQAGPLGASSHIAWPDGYSPWSFPQLGLLFAVTSHIAVGLLDMSAFAGLYAYWVLALGLGTIAALFLFRTFSGRRNPTLQVALAVSIGVGAFPLTRFIQPNVAAFFFVPVVIAVAARYPRATPGSRLALLALAGASCLASGMWWVIVALLIVCTITLIEVGRREWDLVIAAVLTLAASAVGFALQLALYKVSAIDGAASTRGPWDSDLYGGHLSDLLVASPGANALFAGLDIVRPGTSTGNSMVGLVPALAAICAVVALLVGMPRSIRSFDTRVLADFTAVSVLFFLLGGLGNIQAALAVLLGAESPARVWSRLILLLALAGLSWLLTSLACLQATSRMRWLTARWVPAVLAMAVLAAWILDSRQLAPVLPANASARPEAQAVDFLRTALKPCPVAQLPQDGFPTPRVNTSESAAAGLGYRGFVPYLMAPDFSWTFGSWVPGKKAGLNLIPDQLEPGNLNDLAGQGFCAILFDKALSLAATNAGVPLEGRDPSRLSEPDFDSDQFSVYLLPASS